MADKTAEALEKEIKRLSKEIQEYQKYLADTTGDNLDKLAGAIGGMEKKLQTAVDSLLKIQKDNKVAIAAQKETVEISRNDTQAQRNVKLSVENLQKVLKTGRDKAAKLETEMAIANRVDAQKIQAKLDEQIQQNEKVKELLTKAQKQNFGKTMTDISDRIGQEIAQSREIQKNFTSYIAGNRNLLQAIKKDKSGEALEAMVREMALALQKRKGYTKMSLEKLEELVSKNIDVEKAVTNASDVFYGVKQSLSDMKEGILDTLERSKIGGLFTAEMREHWKSGFDEIKNVTEHHFKEIMKPVEILVAPLKGMIKIGMIVWKMLKNRKPTPIEKRTAYWQEETKRIFMLMNKSLYKSFGLEKKRLGLLEDIEKKKDREVEKKKSNWLVGIGALLLGAVSGFVGQLRAAFKGIVEPLMWFGSKINKWTGGFFSRLMAPFEKIAKFFTTGPLGKFFFRMGRLFGAAIQPLMIAWNMFKDFNKMVEMWKANDFAALFGQIGANIMDVILMIPEMLINGILKLAGSDFSVDFGKEKILEMIDNITNGLSDLIWSWFGTDKPSVSGFDADFDPDSYPSAKKSVEDRTANRNAVVVQQSIAKKKKDEEDRKANQMLNQNIENLTTTTQEGSTQVAGSIMINNSESKQTNIPDSLEDSGMAFLGDALGGFP